MSSIAYTARWIFTGVTPPIFNGTIEIDDSGRITNIESRKIADAVDLGNTAIIPALVNAHTHLEFSHLHSPIEPRHPFTHWIKNVVAERHTRQHQPDQSLRQGVNELITSGTVAAGEIATCDNVHYGDMPPELQIARFREFLGFDRDHWDALDTLARNHLVELAEQNSPGGLSPHAPYTVPREFLDRLIQIAIDFHAPIQIHLAESPSERNLLEQGTGELVDMLKRINRWDTALYPSGQSFLEWLELISQSERVAVIHGNYFNQSELDFLADQTNCSLVYCPRTHAYFQHPPHPFRDFHARGGRVALGTDGRSSNPDLSIWNEAVFVKSQHPDLNSDTILKWITANGAHVLGLEQSHGLLGRGRQANFLAVDVRDDNLTPELFHPQDQIRHVVRRGKPILKHPLK